jgi:hypothetical protein
MVKLSAGISRSPRLDFGQGLGQRILRFGCITVQLQTDPESLGHAEKPGQTETCIGSDGPDSGHDFTNASLRDPDFLGQPILRYAEGLQEFLQQNFSRMWVRNLAHIVSPSMIIHDLNILRALCRPHNAHAESIVYSDAVLPGPLTLQRFQPVARGNAQIFQRLRAIEHSRFAHCRSFNAHKTPDPPALQTDAAYVSI